MKPIKAMDEKGNDRIVQFNPEEGEILAQSHLIKLLPFIQYAVKNQLSERVEAQLIDKLLVAEGCLCFEDVGQSISQNFSFPLVVIACDEMIKDRIIVQQNHASHHGIFTFKIPHRVFHFATGKEDKNTLYVRYTALGEANNFDAALDELESIYPHVEKFAASSQGCSH